MNLWAQIFAYFIKMELHDFAVTVAADEANMSPGFWIDCPKNITATEAVLTNYYRTAANLSPYRSQSGFLAKSTFVLEPDFDAFVRVLGDGGLQKRGSVSARHVCICSGLFFS